MTDPSVAPLLRMLLAQTRCEILMRWRVPAFSVSSLALPIVFFVFFGLPVAHMTMGNGVNVGAYLLASFGAYAVGNVMVYGFGIGVANERGMKVDRLLRASPLPPSGLSRTVGLQGPLNFLQEHTQVGPRADVLKSMKAYSDLAITAVQAIASLGTGLRLNLPQIMMTLHNNIPSGTDTEGTARAKLAITNGLMDDVERALAGRADVHVSGIAGRDPRAGGRCDDRERIPDELAIRGPSADEPGTAAG